MESESELLIKLKRCASEDIKPSIPMFVQLLENRKNIAGKMLESTRDEEYFHQLKIIYDYYNRQILLLLEI